MRERLARLREWIGAASVLDLAPRLLLLSLVLSSAARGRDWRLSVPMQSLAFLALVLPPLHRSRAIWGALAALLAVKMVQNWWIQDNHLFLFTYTFGAVFIALSTRDPERSLSTAARLLVGGTFLFAVLWKAFLSPEFTSGEYFEYTFLTDGRFGDLSRFIGGLGEDPLDMNRSALNRLGVPSHRDSVELFTTPTVALLALVSSYWVLAIEAAVAALFLVPTRYAISRLRHGALLLFVVTTYLVASVEMFGLTLLALGLAQCEPRQRTLRLLYLAAIPVLFLYSEASILSGLPPIVPPWEPEIVR